MEENQVPWENGREQKGHGGWPRKGHVYQGIQIFCPKTEPGFETNNDDHNRVTLGCLPAGTEAVRPRCPGDHQAIV